MDDVFGRVRGGARAPPEKSMGMGILGPLMVDTRGPPEGHAQTAKAGGMKIAGKSQLFDRLGVEEKHTKF